MLRAPGLAVGLCRPLAGSKAVSPQHSIATLSLLSASDFVAAREQMCRLRRLSVRGDPLSHPHACLCRSAAGKGPFHSAWRKLGRARPGQGMQGLSRLSARKLGTVGLSAPQARRSSSSCRHASRDTPQGLSRLSGPG